MRRGTIVLVGFMGAGKSVCGRLLARRLGRCFVETDGMVVAAEGRSIPEIFRREGEERFRQLEGEAMQQMYAFALRDNPDLARVGPDSIVDQRLLQRLEQEGFFRQLYGRPQ